MSRTPAVNPNAQDIADKAKYEYVGVTERLGAMHDRLTELADTGLLDADESLNLQDDLFLIWESVLKPPYSPWCLPTRIGRTGTPWQKTGTPTATVVRW